MINTGEQLSPGICEEKLHLYYTANNSGAFSGTVASFMKFLSDLWSSIYAETLIIYTADLRFDDLFLLAAVAWFAIDPIVIAAFRNT